jgi:hypothetical protein
VLTANATYTLTCISTSAASAVQGKAGALSASQSAPSAASTSQTQSTTVSVAAAGSSTVPPQAAAVGYTVQTFGPALTLGQNWFDYNLLTNVPVAGAVVQDGSGVSILGPSGNNYGAGIATARQAGGPGEWTGIAFGGGFYVEAELSFTPTVGPFEMGFPAFWSDDIGMLSLDTPQWPGQAAGYHHWVELDFLQWPLNLLDSYEASDFIDWYGKAAGGSTPSKPSPNTPVNIGGTTFATPNKYGTLWVPATATTKGYLKSYFNGVQVGQTITWDQYNPASPPAPVLGSTAGSFLDAQQVALILGTDKQCPMKVLSVTVWQASTAGNVVR